MATMFRLWVFVQLLRLRNSQLTCSQHPTNRYNPTDPSTNRDQIHPGADGYAGEPPAPETPSAEISRQEEDEENGPYCLKALVRESIPDTADEPEDWVPDDDIDPYPVAPYVEAVPASIWYPYLVPDCGTPQLTPTQTLCLMKPYLVARPYLPVPTPTLPPYVVLAPAVNGNNPQEEAISPLANGYPRHLDADHEPPLQPAMNHWEEDGEVLHGLPFL